MPLLLLPETMPRNPYHTTFYGLNLTLQKPQMWHIPPMLPNGGYRRKRQGQEPCFDTVDCFLMLEYTYRPPQGMMSILWCTYWISLPPKSS
jgi:hypothetical protein